MTSYHSCGGPEEVPQTQQIVNQNQKQKKQTKFSTYWLIYGNNFNWLNKSRDYFMTNFPQENPFTALTFLRMLCYGDSFQS